MLFLRRKKMKSKWKKIMMNPWTVAIGSGLVLSIISVINCSNV